MNLANRKSAFEATKKKGGNYERRLTDQHTDHEVGESEVSRANDRIDDFVGLHVLAIYLPVLIDSCEVSAYTPKI